jgi:hypothetical protein
METVQGFVSLWYFTGLLAWIPFGLGVGVLLYVVRRLSVGVVLVGVLALYCAISYYVFMSSLFLLLPEQGNSFWAALRQGGPLVPLLLGVLALQLPYVVERFMTMRAARGRERQGAFVEKLRQAILGRDLAGAIAICTYQDGMTAQVLKACLGTYDQQTVRGTASEAKLRLLDQTAAYATGRERWALNVNTIILIVASSLGFLVGVIGIGRGVSHAFRAMGNTGAVDATALAYGISETLFVSAPTLVISLLGVIACLHAVRRTRVAGHETMQSVATVKQALSEMGA